MSAEKIRSTTQAILLCFFPFISLALLACEKPLGYSSLEPGCYLNLSISYGMYPEYTWIAAGDPVQFSRSDVWLGCIELDHKHRLKEAAIYYDKSGLKLHQVHYNTCGFNALILESFELQPKRYLLLEDYGAGKERLLRGSTHSNLVSHFRRPSEEINCSYLE